MSTMDNFLPENKWKPLVGFEETHAISDIFEVKRLRITRKFGKQNITLEEKICKVSVGKTGYKTVYIAGKGLEYLHRLIAINFIPNPNNYPQVNHINGIKTDNRIENLEWCSARQNVIHAFKTGLMKGIKRHGSENASCKFSLEKVKKVKSLKGKQTLSKTANEFGISITHVWQIQNNKNRNFN